LEDHVRNPHRQPDKGDSYHSGKRRITKTVTDKIEAFATQQARARRNINGSPLQLLSARRRDTDSNPDQARQDRSPEDQIRTTDFQTLASISIVSS
jgi:hypothetical protein